MGRPGLQKRLQLEGLKEESLQRRSGGANEHLEGAATSSACDLLEVDLFSEGAQQLGPGASTPAGFKSPTGRHHHHHHNRQQNLECAMV